MSKYHDDNSFASSPGRLALSDVKLRCFHPEVYTPWAHFLAGLPRFFSCGLFGASFRWRDIVAEHLIYGDSRAALVMQMTPLIVAAYTDELDAVVLLRFAPWVAEQFGIRSGQRLLTVNTYAQPGQCPLAEDIRPGPEQCRRYTDFWPIIADFLTDDRKGLEERKAKISDREWQRAEEMADRLMNARTIKFRNGAPLKSESAAD